MLEQGRMRAESFGRIRLRLTPARAKGWLWQGLLVIAVVLVAWFFAHNAAENLARKNLPFGFDFLARTAGFDIPFKLVDWTVTNTYGRAVYVAILNTLLISALSVVAATVLGLLLGLLRLSSNWLARVVSMAVIEAVRNTPQLVQIFFFYVAVLQTLPQTRNSLRFWDVAFLNIRGLYLPTPLWSDAALPALLGFVASLAVAGALWRWRLRLTRTWRPFLVVAGFVLPLLVLLAGWRAGALTGFSVPELRGFNFRGGVQIPPELVALWFGLSVYASAFIAEIVRGAMQGIAYGQTEAALSLGLSRWQTLRLVVLPQALRIIVPPLTSQYLNIIKSSSLGAGIAYPEVFQIVIGTVLNQSGRAIEVIIIVMLFFLAINLATSLFMNWYNRAIALKER
jgi:general L-amino acid transport system permease protein